jgi:hypothetical protein
MRKVGVFDQSRPDFVGSGWGNVNEVVTLHARVRSTGSGYKTETMISLLITILLAVLVYILLAYLGLPAVICIVAAILILLVGFAPYLHRRY